MPIQTTTQSTVFFKSFLHYVFFLFEEHALWSTVIFYLQIKLHFHLIEEWLLFAA
jgi:hypothetical protein